MTKPSIIPPKIPTAIKTMSITLFLKIKKPALDMICINSYKLSLEAQKLIKYLLEGSSLLQSLYTPFIRIIR
jgi:hypothetical protein